MVPVSRIHRPRGADRRGGGAPSPRRYIQVDIGEHIVVETEAYRGPGREAHRRRDGGISKATYEGHIAVEAEAAWVPTGPDPDRLRCE